MSDENKEATKVEKSAEQNAQLSEKELEKVSGGKPTESISISYEQIQYQYYTRD
jgi:bacteriocin-like protein